MTKEQAPETIELGCVLYIRKDGYDKLQARLAEAERLLRNIDTLRLLPNEQDRAEVRAFLRPADSADAALDDDLPAPTVLTDDECDHIADFMELCEWQGIGKDDVRLWAKAFDELAVLRATPTADVRPWHTANCGINQDDPCDCGGGASLTVPAVQEGK